MTASVEEAGCHLVAGKIVDGTERYKYEVVAFGVLAERYGKAHVLDLQRHVDETLAVALGVLETLKVVARECEIGGVEVVNNVHLLVENITLKTQAMFAENVIDVTIYSVLVDALGEELADDEENLRRIAGKGEASSVGHHATIDRNGKLAVELREKSKLPDKTEHHLARGAERRA